MWILKTCMYPCNSHSGQGKDFFSHLEATGITFTITTISEKLHPSLLYLIIFFGLVLNFIKES